MLKGKKPWLTGIIGGLIIPLLVGMATPAFARGISFKDAGIALWIFIIIGAIIVLLQLIPAIILFFSFVGTGTGLVAKKKASEKVAAEEKGILTGVETAPVKNRN
jgi:cytochrome bd-type quinol oxidase subunit 2